MPAVHLTQAQIADAIGTPIILASAWDRTTEQWVVLTLGDLGPAAVAAAVAWVNARLSTP